MRRTRLAAAIGVAALTLGATAAAATNTQTVTINVQAAERTVTAPNPVTLTANIGEDISGASAKESTGILTYTNPVGNEPAKITVTSEGTELGLNGDAGQLTLTVASATPSGGGTAASAVSIAANDVTGDLVTGIDANTTAGSAVLTFAFSSAESEPLTDLVTVVRTVTYTIGD